MSLEAYQTRVASEKRAQILAAAERLFLEHGYAGAAMDRVAKRAGVSSATVFKHFKTKADLFAAVIEGFLDAAPAPQALAQRPRAPRDGLMQLGRAYAERLLQPGALGLVRVVIAETPRFAHLGRRLYARLDQPAFERVHSYLAAERAAGAMRVAEPAQAARRFLAAIAGELFWPRLLIDPGPDVAAEAAAPARIEAAVAAAADALLAEAADASA